MKQTGPLREFSSGYYAIDLRVTEFDDGPMIDRHLFNFIERIVYANTDAPVWFKANFDTAPYFQPGGDEPMPTDLIALPEKWMDEFGIPSHEANELHTFYVCKPGHAHHLSQSELLGDTFLEGDGDE